MTSNIHHKANKCTTLSMFGKCEPLIVYICFKPQIVVLIILLALFLYIGIYPIFVQSQKLQDWNRFNTEHFVSSRKNGVDKAVLAYFDSNNNQSEVYQKWDNELTSQNMKIYLISSELSSISLVFHIYDILIKAIENKVEYAIIIDRNTEALEPQFKDNFNHLISIWPKESPLLIFGCSNVVSTDIEKFKQVEMISRLKYASDVYAYVIRKEFLPNMLRYFQLLMAEIQDRKIIEPYNSWWHTLLGNEHVYVTNPSIITRKM